MGYDYIQEQQCDVELDDVYDDRPLMVVISNILKQTRRLTELHVIRDEENQKVFHLTWKNLEHGVTY
jgi:hypothetical protein